MCNLYSVEKSPDEITRVARSMRSSGTNLAPGRIYPDYAAPIVRTASDGVRELATARWGMPTPAKRLVGKRVDRGLTNIRHLNIPHWRQWQGEANRCLVPFDAFSEPGRDTAGASTNVWFALAAGRPLAFFAGFWTQWTSTRKLKEGEVTIDVFAFLTTNANSEVAAVHPKAMPVILSDPESLEIWMDAPWSEAQHLQRPLPDGTLVRLEDPTP